MFHKNTHEQKECGQCLYARLCTFVFDTVCGGLHVQAHLCGSLKKTREIKCLSKLFSLLSYAVILIPEKQKPSERQKHIVLPTVMLWIDLWQCLSYTKAEFNGSLPLILQNTHKGGVYSDTVFFFCQIKQHISIN